MGDMFKKMFMKVFYVLIIGMVIGVQVHIAWANPTITTIEITKTAELLPSDIKEEIESIEIKEDKEYKEIKEVKEEFKNLSIEEKIFETFGEEGNLALRVARAESGLNPKAMNTNANTGDYSVGLFQINLIGSLFEGRLARAEYLGYTGERTREALTLWLQNEDNNILYARSMSRTNGWSAWSTFKNGNY